ncbi:hypothetical protein PRIPAC_74042 [Pristionchus pacificus]|uniref:G protein-coupled receptor n=1 Tax=Pristionchus pacificus TaxID=54126 RepID=A0A2A6C090_PRIPA|nr:hypothetical protein PRIPAC_74042 [Pristionchus pacificus]|eukprot:PDM71529.1 G protein-coupled receptor [Pristionchus pacificus]
MPSPFLLHLIHYVVCTVGIAANSLVLFLVWKRTPTSLKSYSILIAFDAVVQLSTCFCSGVLFTRVVSVDDAALSIVSGPARLTGLRRYRKRLQQLHSRSPEFCFILDSLMIFGYPHYSIMLVACFAFRYQVLTKSAPEVKTTVVIALFLSFPTVLITWFINQVLYAITPLDTQENLRSKLLSPSDVTQPIIAIGLTYACLPSLPATIIVIYFARKIYRFLEENSIYMTEQMRDSQKEIVTGLVIQACLPILYVIGIICYTLGQFNIVDSYMLEYSMNMGRILTIILLSPNFCRCFSSGHNVLSIGIDRGNYTLSRIHDSNSCDRDISIKYSQEPILTIFAVTGPDCLSYISHVCVFAHSVLKALQIVNRFTALFLPLRHDNVFKHARVDVVQLTFQDALYIDGGGGRVIYIGIKKSDRELAKILITSIFGLFILVTLPMNVLLLVKIYGLRRENITLFHKEKTYFVYVLVITVARVISGAHQIFWLVATKTENTSLTILAQNIYAYPNTIITFIPPIVLILMSKPVRDGIRFFYTHLRSGAVVVHSTVSHKRLPLLDKQIYLDTPCYQYVDTELNYEINDHKITASKTNLRIIHSSRLLEKMDRKRRAKQNDAEEPKRINVEGQAVVSVRDPASLSWLERLPQDLLGDLLDRVPEAIQHLRRTSRTLRNGVHEYAKGSSTITLIRELKLFWNKTRQYPEGALKCTFLVLFGKSKLFEMRLKMRYDHFSISHPADFIVRSVSNTGSRKEAHYVFLFKTMEYHALILEFLNDCMGLRIGRVDFSLSGNIIQSMEYNISKLQLCAEPSNFDSHFPSTHFSIFLDDNIPLVYPEAIVKLLERIRMKEFKLTASTSNILNPILLRNIGFIQIHIQKVTISDPKELLIRLSTHIRGLNIEQKDNCYKYDQIARPLFSVDNSDWPQLILEMFSPGKLDKLCIEHLDYYKTNYYYLSLDGADLLRNRLPWLNKHIYFDTPCDQYANNRLDYEVNDHYVRGSVVVREMNSTEESKEYHQQYCNPPYIPDPDPPSTRKNHIVHCEKTRAFILRAHAFMAENGVEDLSPSLLSKLLSIHPQTVSRTIDAAKDSPPITRFPPCAPPPLKQTKKAKEQRIVGRFSPETIEKLRRYMHVSFFAQYKRVTLKLIKDGRKEWLAESDKEQTVNTSTIRLLLHGMNFAFIKLQCRTSIYMNEYYCSLQANFLRSMLEIRTEGKCLIWSVDETWVHKGMRPNIGWTDKEAQKAPLTFIKNGLTAGNSAQWERGERLVIVACLSEHGFRCPLIWRTGKVDDGGDYHKEMNSEEFEKYIQNVFKELVKEAEERELRPVLLMDNASYHSRVLDKMPTTNDRKAVISDWLVRKGIDCPAGLKKKELVDKLKKLSRKEHNIYIVDKMAEDYGVTLVRTPPYMAEFAPIELGWSAMKRAQYDLINRTDDGRVIREKLLEWMENYPAEKCKSYMEHSRKKRIAEGLGMLPKLVVCLLLVHTATAFVRVRRTDVQKLQHEVLHLLNDDLSGGMHKREETPYRMRSCKAAEMAERRLRGLDARKMRIGKLPHIGDLKFLKKYCRTF